MQGLTSGQDEWWSLLAIDFSSAHTEQLLCTAGAEIESADWGWVALWAALGDRTVGWRERRDWTSALHSICRYTVQSLYSVHVVSVYRTVRATLLRSHPSCDSFAASTLCDRPVASCRAPELAQTGRVPSAGRSVSAHARGPRGDRVLLHKGLIEHELACVSIVTLNPTRSFYRELFWDPVTSHTPRGR